MQKLIFVWGRALFAAAIVFLAAAQSYAAGIGRFQFVFGEVSVLDSSGRARAAVKGAEINEGDTVVSGAVASAQLRMIDGAFAAVRPDSRVRFDEYRYSGKEDGSERGLISLLKGGLRAITGVIGRTNRNAYSISTPTATIGIRGTDHETVYIPSSGEKVGSIKPVPSNWPLPSALLGPAVAPEDLRAAVRLAQAYATQTDVDMPFLLAQLAPGAGQPNTLPGNNGTWNTPFVGSTSITSQGNTIVLLTGMVGFAPPGGSPQIVPVSQVPPNIFSTTPPPGKGTQQGQGQQSVGSTGGTSGEQVRLSTSSSDGGAPLGAGAGGTTGGGTGGSTAGGAGSTGGASGGAPGLVQPVTLTDSTNNGLVIDYNQQTVGTSSGNNVPLTEGAFAIQAQTAAVQAAASANAASAAATTATAAVVPTQSAVTSLNGVATVSTAPAVAAITAANPVVTLATSAVNSANALAAVDLTTATNAVSTATTATNAAQTAVNAIAASPISTAAGASAISAATSAVATATTSVNNAASAVTTASPLVSAATALAPVNVATASSNAATGTTAFNQASTQASQAQAAFTANGAFADQTIAVAANSAVTSALPTLQSANTSLQKTVSTLPTDLALSAVQQASALTAAQSAAGSVLTSANQSLTSANSLLTQANTDLTAANSQLSTATGANTSFTSAKTSAQSSLSTATSQLGLANTDLSAAQSANTTLTQNKTNAMQSLTSANNSLSTANTALTTATADNAVITSSHFSATTLTAQASTAASAAAGLVPQAQQAAQTAQTAAQLAATKQAAGDFAAAQAAALQAQQAAQSAASFAAQATQQQQIAEAALASANALLNAATNANTDASAKVTSASTAAGAAQSSASTAQTQAALVAPAQSAASTSVSSAQSEAAAAQTAASGAQTNAGTASTQLAAAQTAADQAVTKANLASSGATGSTTTNANAAQSAAANAQAQASNAQTAKTAGDGLVAAGSTSLISLQSAATAIGTNYLQAQYSNPAVASNNFRHIAALSQTVPGGFETSRHGALTAGQSNTTYVLDETKFLTEIRNGTYNSSGLNYSGVSYANADIKFSGGARKDFFKAPDNSAYLGRWEGGNVLVDDLASGPNPDLTISLVNGDSTLRSAHWLLATGQASPYSFTAGTTAPVQFVQTLVGSLLYPMTAFTHPTDLAGNVGNVTGASLTANFSKQTVDFNFGLAFSTADPVNISTKNMAFLATGTNVAIVKNQGFTAQGTSGLTISPCTGANCPAFGFAGRVDGNFGGSAAAGAGLSYGFVANTGSVPPPNTPNADAIQGVIAFGAATPPTQGTNPAVTGTGQFRHQIIFPADTASNGYTINQYVATNGVTIGASPTGNAGTYLVRGNRPATDLTAESNTDFLLDASGNLVRVQQTPYRVQDRGNDVTALQSGNAIPATATVSLSGGTVEGNSTVNGITVGGSYNDATNGIRTGRYQGGTVTVEDFADTIPAGFVNLGNRSALWAVREIPPSIPVTGSFSYNPVFATRPVDSLGNLGVLNYASLTANFTGTPTVDPAVSVSINNQTLTATGSHIPLNSVFAFNVNNGIQNQASDILRVSCFGSNCATAAPTSPNVSFGCTAAGTCGGTYGVNINGGFAGANGQAGGAFLSYMFDTRYNPGDPQAGTRPTNDYITGNVAFTKSPLLQVTPAAPNGSAFIATSYFDGTFNSTDQHHTRGFRTSPTSFTSPFGAGVPNSVAEDPLQGDHDTPRFENLSAGTVAQAPTNATSSAATGVSFGRYAGTNPVTPMVGPTLGTGSDGNTTSFPRTVIGSYHWIKGPEAFPFLLAQALTGTATYNFDGGTAPTDQNNMTGTVNSASLSVNFTKQAVSTSIQVTMPINTFNGGTSNRVWNASATDIRLGGDSQFNACSGCSSVHQNLTVSLNGQLGGSGDINGQLTGVGLSGAGIAYAFAGNDPSNSFQHEHVNGAVAFALNSFTQTPNGTNVTTNGTAAINSNNIEYALGLVASGLNATAGAVQSDNLTQLDGGAAALSRVTRDANGIPTVFDGKAIIVIPTNPACGPTPCPAFVNETPAKLSILQTDVNTAGGGTAATLLESGRDPITGIVWGRYGGGKIAVFDRIGGAGAFAPTTIDVATQNWHGIFGPQQSGPVTLPTSGTFAYTFVGGTSPTDNFGNVGTLTSANLTANFTNMTVNAGVNLTVAGNTWIANANAAPIQKGTFFQAQVGTTTSPLSVTVNGSAAGTAGSLVGGFVGTSGQGLAMAYSLNRTPGQTLVAPFLTNGTTVSGVAAFKR